MEHAHARARDALKQAGEALELGGPDLLIVASDGDGEVAEARLRELATRLPFKGSLQP